MPIGIGTTFDYGLPFEPMCRMIARAGFRAITIGGGDIAHSGYDTVGGPGDDSGRNREARLRIDSVHAPFGPDADLSVPDIRTEMSASDPPVAPRNESDASHADMGRGGTPYPPDSLGGLGSAPLTDAQATGEQLLAIR